MSYMGYVHLMTEFLKFRAKQKQQKLWILEIGVDRGQTALPLLSNLLQENLDWAMIGVDIRYDASFDQQLAMMTGIRKFGVIPQSDEEDSGKHWNYLYQRCNSLDYLPLCIENVDKKITEKFDLVLLDGDHNYETVRKELDDLMYLVHENSMIIIDDVHGRHTDCDSFYSDYPAHSNIEHKELDRNASRQGVNNAVHDFLEHHHDWHITDLGKIHGGEPIALTKNLVMESTSKELLLMQPSGPKTRHNLHRYCQQWHFSIE
jgi:hypothetical protein